jgi:hypothetical protein
MSDEAFTLEETLSRLAGVSADKLSWEMDNDPNGGLSCVFLNGSQDRGPHAGRRRVCVFCKNPILPPDWTSLEVETTDKGKVYIFFCGPHCFGGPKIEAPTSTILGKLKRVFDMGRKR